MCNCKSVFITATGTDIGKTYISGLLLKQMIDFELNCGYYKPVLSGAILQENGKLLPGDCDFVLKKAKLDIDPLKCLSYCFEQAVSPHLAAKINNTEITYEKILEDYSDFKSNYDYLIIEGAGGITCPLNLDNNKKFLLSDLISKLNTNIIIVADGGLGTINSVLLTTEFAQKRNLKISGIILNNYDKSNFMHVDNKKQIEYLTGINVIATVEKDSNQLEISKNDLIKVFS